MRLLLVLACIATAPAFADDSLRNLIARIDMDLATHEDRLRDEAAPDYKPLTLYQGVWNKPIEGPRRSVGSARILALDVDDYLAHVQKRRPQDYESEARSLSEVADVAERARLALHRVKRDAQTLK